MEAMLEEAKMTFPLDAAEIVRLQINVEAYEDGLKRLNALKAEFEF